MLKINKVFIVSSIIITIILIVFIRKLSYPSKYISTIHDIKEELIIEDNKLNIRYLKGNMIDESIDYGNVLTKVIEIKNKTNVDLSYAIKLNESEISNQHLSYRVYESDSQDDNSFNLVTKDSFLQANSNLGYNFYIKSKSKKYLKIEFKSNYESEKTTFKGVLKVVSNLTDKDIFISNTNRLISELNKKINSLNGINVPGIYIINASVLNVPDYYGYILIDAKDISDLKYYLTIYNDKLMVENLNYNKIQKKYIVEKNNEKIPTINEDYVCSNYSKKECLSFNNITYHENGGRKNFDIESKKIINTIQSNFKKSEKEVYVYNVKEDIDSSSSIEGFILINNTLDKPEYYLYIHNYLFMVSGYNLTKLGEYKSDSNTIRAYNQTAFNLTSTKNKVCTFSGFTNCLDKFDNLIVE